MKKKKPAYKPVGRKLSPEAQLRREIKRHKSLREKPFKEVARRIADFLFEQLSVNGRIVPLREACSYMANINELYSGMATLLESLKAHPMIVVSHKKTKALSSS